MPKLEPKPLRTVVLLAAWSGTVMTVAAEPRLPPTTPAASAASPEESGPRQNVFGIKPVSAATLAAKRGGERPSSDAQLSGSVSGNQASNLSTGMNVVGEGALAGSSGVLTVVQNSGNNVLIQNSVIVNLQLK